MFNRTLVFFIVVIFWGIACQKKEAETIKIGAVVFLTGGAAQYGQWVKKGLELAKDQINVKGGVRGKKIAIIYEDDRTSSQVAVASIKKLIAIDKVTVIISGLTSSSTLAIAPVAEQNKVVLFSPCSSSPAITHSGDFIFRNWPSDNIEGQVMAQYAFSKLGVRKVSILAMNNDYALGLKEIFQKSFIELGGKVLSMDVFNENQTDFKTIIAKIKQMQPAALYLPSHAREAAYVIKQMKEMGVSLQILSSVTFESPEIYQIAGSATEGAFYTAPAFDPSSNDTNVVSFRVEYEKRYGKLPEVFAAHSYDALRIIAYAIEKGGYSADSIKTGLYSLKEYSGVSGLTSFDQNGDVIKPAMIKTVKNGAFTSIELAK